MVLCVQENYGKWLNTPYTHQNRDAIISKLLSIDRSMYKLWTLMDFDKTRLSFASGRLQLTNGQAMNALAIICRESLTR